MAGKYIVGIDVGTSACKCILVDECGTVLVSSSSSYPCSMPEPGWVEQDPSDWWDAASKSLSAVIEKGGIAANEIVAVGLSAQMHGLVALDKELQVIRPAILWNDQRTTGECEQIYELVGGRKKLLDYTNNLMLPGYTGSKILWLRREEPANYERARYFLNPKDYLRLQLTGNIATDVSDASGTGLLDVKNRVWNKSLLSVLDIEPAKLPRVYESIENTGQISQSAARRTGLAPGTKVCAGGGDSVIQTSGTGVLDEKKLMSTIGTAGILATGLRSFRKNCAHNLQVFCNNTPDTWHVMGVTLSAGASYRWFVERFCNLCGLEEKQSDAKLFQLIDERAARSAPGAQKLLFLPYLNGERCPHTSSAARGVFFGLNLSHDIGDLARAVMEGVIYSLRDVYEQVRLLCNMEGITEIRSSGGGSASKLWCQIHADVFQLPVSTVSGASEGGAYGAALVAGVSAGMWKSLEQAVEVLKISSYTEPDVNKSNIYEDLFQSYRRLYPALEGEFDLLEKIKY